MIKGRLYVAGGQNSLSTSTGTESLYVYDPVTNKWKQKANMPQPSAEGVSGVIGSQLYVQAACSTDGKCDGTAFDVYNPATDMWTALASVPVATTNGSAAVIAGKLYTAAYSNAGGTLITTTQVYDPVSNTWTPIANMPTAVTVAAGVRFKNQFYVFGGLNGGCPLTLVQVYDPTKNRWKAYSPAMPLGLAYESAEVAGGIVYVQGTSNQGGCSGVRGNNQDLVP